MASAKASADGRHVVVSWTESGVRDGARIETVIYPLDILGAAQSAKFGDLTPDERDHFQVGSPEERREQRRGWTGGQIFGVGSGAEK